MPDKLIGYDAEGNPIYAPGGGNVIGYDANGKPVTSATEPRQSEPWTLRKQAGAMLRTIPMAGFGPGNPLGQMLGNTAADLVEDPAGALPSVGAQVGALAGTLVNPGLGSVAGASAGGAAGRALQNYIKAKPIGEGVVGDAVAQGAMQAVPVVGRGLKAAGRSIYAKALRPAASDMRKMAESAGGALEHDVRGYLADVGLSNRLPIHHSGLQRAEALKDQLEAGIQQKLEASNAQIDMPAVVDDAERYLAGKFGGQNIPQEDMATVTGRMGMFKSNPALQKPVFRTPPETRGVMGERIGPGRSGPVQDGTVFANRQPVAKINAMRVASNKNVKDKFGSLGSAGVETEKAISRAESEAVKGAVPGVRDDFKKWHDLINFQKALVRTAGNAENAQPVRLYELLGILSGNPAAMGLGVMSRPAAQGFAGQATYNLGDRLGKTPAEAIRLMLMQRMTGAENER